MSGETIFITTGPAKRAAYATASSHVRRQLLAGHGDPVRVGDHLALGGGESAAALGADGFEQRPYRELTVLGHQSDHSVRLEQAQFLVPEPQLPDEHLGVVLAEQG